MARKLAGKDHYLLFSSSSEADSRAYHRIKIWEDYSRLVLHSEPTESAILFLHEMQASNKPPRIVCIELNWYSYGTFDDTLLKVSTIGFQSYFPDIVSCEYRRSDTSSPIQQLLDTFVSNARIYTGIADEKDASHFSIKMDLGGLAGIIEGWLLPDGTVRFAIRDEAHLIQRIKQLAGRTN